MLKIFTTFDCLYQSSDNCLLICVYRKYSNSNTLNVHTPSCRQWANSQVNVHPHVLEGSMCGQTIQSTVHIYSHGMNGQWYTILFSISIIQRIFNFKIGCWSEDKVFDVQCSENYVCVKVYIAEHFGIYFRIGVIRLGVVF